MKNPFQKSARFISAGVCLLLCLLANRAGATTTTWDPEGSNTQSPYYTGSLSGTWETSNWDTANESGTATLHAWVEGTAALFAANSGTGTPAFTVTMNANHTVAGIFDGPDNPNPCPVTIQGTGTMILLAGNANGFDITGDGAGDPGGATINNVITGGSTAALYLEGYGSQIYLNAANTYSGATVLGYSGAAFINTVNFNNSASFGTGSIVVSNTAALNCGFAVQGSSAITLANAVIWPANSYNNGMNIVGNAAGLTFSGAWTLTSTARLGSYGSGNLVVISGVMSGAGGLNYSVSAPGSTGLLELTAINTYTGTTTITNGTLQLGDGSAKSGNIAGAITITPPGNLVWANPTALTYAKVMSGTGSVTFQGPGVLTLAGANTYSGSTTISAGTVKLGVANALSSKSAVTLTSTLDMGGFSTSIDALNGTGTVDNSTGTGTYTLTVGANNGTGAFSGVIQNTSGAVALTKSGTGTETLSGADTYLGNTIISAGTLQLGAANTLPAGTSVTVADGATLDLQSYSDTIAALSVGGLPSGPGSVNNFSGTLTVNGNASPLNGQNFNGYSCISATINGSGSLIKGGTHTMAFRGNNTYSGWTMSLTGGTLSVGALPNALPTSLALNVPAGALFQLDANSQSVVSLSGSGSVNLGGGTLTIQGGGGSTFSGVIQNSELPGSSTALGNGLRGYYYTNIDMTGLKSVTDNAQVNVPWGPPNGYALACNGTSTGYGALVIPSGSLTGTYTVECWAYPSNTTANISMIGTRRPTDYGFDMKFDGGGILIHGDIGTGTAWITSTADAPFTFAANTWYHMAYVVTPTNYTIYANGNQIGTGSYTSATPVLYDANHNIFIGQYGAGEYFNGLLGEVRMWNTARTATQIQTNMNRQLVGNETGLAGYWRCNDGSGTTLTAAVGVNGTLAASTGWAATSPVTTNSDYGSARWLGQVLTTAGGTYTFTTTTGVGARLWVNGTPVIDGWVSQGATARSGSIALAANTRYDIVMECFNGAAASLSWTPPGDTVSVMIPSSNLFLPGAGSLVVGNGGEQVLTAPSTYTGGTTVENGGSLDATVNGALSSGNVTVAPLSSGGTLELDASGIIAPTADLILDTSTTEVYLNFTGTNKIHGISFADGTTYAAPGVYGANGGANNPYGFFMGSGYLLVTATNSVNTLTASAGTVTPAVYGSPVVLAATITGSSPTGTVTFWDGANWLGSSPLVAGLATLSVSNLMVINNPHNLTAVYSGDANNTASTSSAVSVSTSVATITPTPVVANKTYDGTTAATVVSSNSFAGILPSDTNYVYVSGYTLAFSDPYVGVNKTVTISGMALGGSLDGNYVLSTTSVNTTASITNKVVTVSGLTATNRVYDANTDEGATGTATLNGVLAADAASVTLGGTPVFAFTNKIVGLAKPVTVGGYALPATGLATNYILVLTNLSANVSNFPVAIINVTANNKTYDGTTNATLNGTPALSPTAFAGDVVNISATSVVASFASATVGTAKPVTVTGYALTGTDAANYTNSQPSGLTANITQNGTLLAIAPSANPSTATSNVTFTLTVTATATTTKPPTGTATFYTNAVPIGTGTLVSNTPMSAIALFSTVGLPIGTTPVEGNYGGDANFLQPASGIFTNQVVQSSTTCSLTNAILSVTPNGGYSFTLNLQGTYKAQYYVLSQTNAAEPMANWLVVPGSSNTVANANGQWSCTVTNPAPAFYRVQAMDSCSP